MLTELTIGVLVSRKSLMTAQCPHQALCWVCHGMINLMWPTRAEDCHATIGLSTTTQPRAKIPLLGEVLQEAAPRGRLTRTARDLRPNAVLRKVTPDRNLSQPCRCKHRRQPPVSLAAY